MVEKPAVFISSTSDLRSARDLVAKVLLSMGYEPVWQDVEPTDGGELLAVLRERMEPCALMIQLVGHRYGAEPPHDLRSPEFGRVSFTQFEALHFEQALRRKVIYHFLAPEFPTDPVSPEPHELAALQADYRKRIHESNRLHQADIATAQDLVLSVHRIRGELAAFRRQSDARYRRVLVLSGSALAGVAAVAALLVGGVHVLHRGQAQQSTQMADQSARRAAETDELARQLARIEKELLSQKRVNPAAAARLSDADLVLLDRARKDADLKVRAAASVLKPDADTDALLAELASRQQDGAFDLAMLQGKRWYHGQPPKFDRAVLAFERAIAIRPHDFEARRYTADALLLAGQHSPRVLEICEETVRLVPRDSPEWAMTQVHLGWARLTADPTNIGGDATGAIEAFEAALTVFTRERFPIEWAVTQRHVGATWQVFNGGNRRDNALKAIDGFEAALQVLTPEDHPWMWAITQSGLAATLMSLGELDGDDIHIARAIAIYEVLLSVYKRQTSPREWANTQVAKGSAWLSLRGGNRQDNASKAVAAYQAALDVFAPNEFPDDWAWVQDNLRRARDHMTFPEAATGE